MCVNPVLWYSVSVSVACVLYNSYIYKLYIRGYRPRHFIHSAHGVDQHQILLLLIDFPINLMFSWFHSSTCHLPSGPVPVIQPLNELLVDATIRVYSTITSQLLPTPAKSHYTFNLRDLSKVFQGVLMVEAGDIEVVGCQSITMMWPNHVTIRKYSAVQKFGVIQRTSCFPWKLSLLLIKLIAKWILNIVKTLTRWEIMIFIVNINVVLLVAQRKASFIASLSSITVFNCAHIKRVFKGSLPLCSSSKAITQCTIGTLEMGLYTLCRDFIKHLRIVMYTLTM